MTVSIVIMHVTLSFIAMYVTVSINNFIRGYKLYTNWLKELFSTSVFLIDL